jgi:RNA chaperone Hfq
MHLIPRFGPQKRAGCAGPLRSSMPVSSIQESFFHAALQGNKHITVQLLNGTRLSGRVRSFDKHSVILETRTLEQLVFKHSISAAGVCCNRHCLECFPELAKTEAASAVGKHLADS